MFQLATKPRHQWGTRQTIPASQSGDGLERSFKQCAVCQIKRITVIDAACEPRRYQFPDGIEFERDTEPTCGQVATFEERLAS